jgi:hypothetical protein
MGPVSEPTGAFGGVRRPALFAKKAGKSWKKSLLASASAFRGPGSTFGSSDYFFSENSYGPAILSSEAEF